MLRKVARSNGCRLARQFLSVHMSETQDKKTEVKKTLYAKSGSTSQCGFQSYYPSLMLPRMHSGCLEPYAMCVVWGTGVCI